MSPSYDEMVILPSGYVYLKTGMWHLIPEHPPLIPALCALPLLALNPNFDSTDTNLAPETKNEWAVGSSFFSHNDVDRMLFWGRLPILLLALLLGYFVYRWAKEIYGSSAGLIALLLYAFCPTVITFSGFTSHDIGVACFSTLCLYWLWRFLGQGTWHNLLWTGLLLGLALASKTTAVVLPPVFVVLTLLAVWRHPRTEGESAKSLASVSSLASPLATDRIADRLARAFVALGLIFLLAFAVLYTVYLFPSDPLFYVRTVLRARPLHNSAYPFYLMGQLRLGGWWYQFPLAFAIKMPIPIMFLILLALWQWYRGGARWFPEAFVVLPALAHFTLISALADPLGVRYLISSFPLLFIFASRTAPLFTRSQLGIMTGIFLIAWYLSIPVRIYPDYMAYFNEFVGGPKHGIEYLSEADIDWGQNLKRLKRYLDEHHFERVKLLYMGLMPPEYYGIRVETMQWEELAHPRGPGIYILPMHGVVRAKGYLGVDWLKRYELIDVVGYAFYVFRVI